MSVRRLTVAGPASHVRPEPWWRPRPATFVCGLVLAALLAAFNLLGGVVVEVEIAHKSFAAPQLAHSTTTHAGWPWAFLCVAGDRFWPLAHLDETVYWTRPAALLADLAVTALVATGGAWIFGQRFQSRRRWRQFGLLDLALVTAAVAVILGLFVVPRASHDRDQSAVARLEGTVPHDRQMPRDDRPRVERAVWQPGPTATLRRVLGDKLIPDTGHVVALDAYGGNIRDIVQLRGLRVLRLYGTVSDSDLNRLAGLPWLESLDISDTVLRKDRGGWLDTPSVSHDYTIRLPHLKRLFAEKNVLQGSDLSEFAGLEELNLAGSRFDDDSACAIGALPSLRILDLGGTDLSDVQLAVLAGLPRLELLDISGTRVTDAGMACLARLPRLETLVADNTAITDEGLPDLCRCPRLWSLHLRGAKVTTAGLARLASTRPSCLVKR